MDYKVQQISVATTEDSENMLKGYAVRDYNPSNEEVEKV